MKVYKVGELLQEGITRYQEGMKFDFLQDGPVLLIFFNNPTTAEIEAIRSGKLEIGLYERDSVIFILTKFQGQQWMDAPYSIHMSKPFEFQELSYGMGFGLNILLTDAATGVLRAIRLVGLPTAFSQKLRYAMERQKEQPFDIDKYNKKINEIFGNYSTDGLAIRAEKIRIK